MAQALRYSNEITMAPMIGDATPGKWQLGMTEWANERSAFCTWCGLFQFTRMPFGLAGDPAPFCRLMSIVFKDHLWKICLSYLDYVIVYARTAEERLHRLRTALNPVRENAHFSSGILSSRRTWCLPMLSTQSQTSFRQFATAGRPRIACATPAHSSASLVTTVGLYVTSR